MRRVFTLLAVFFVLTTCLVCPVAEMFDHWDHTLQTGQDTESTLILVALCVGGLYSLAGAIFRFIGRKLAASRPDDRCGPERLAPAPPALILIPISPPALALRL